MKQIVTYFILTILCYSTTYAQKLTLTELMTLCNKKNWEDVNSYLLSKKWTYYESEKGNTYKYNTITWSFNKGQYNDRAEAWFYLYTYDGYPNKITYSVFNKEAYSLIQNSISSSGLKLVNSEINDNEIISTYSGSAYTLKISTGKRQDNEWRDRSITAYTITLIKKGGIFDPGNGKKTDYYDNGTIKAEYTLSDGKFNGVAKIYHENGELERIGNYTNGLENGLFKDFDENGKLVSEVSMLNGKMNGLFKMYEDNKILLSSTFKNGIKTGEYVKYIYHDTTGELLLKHVGDYIEGKKEGTWKLSYVEGKNAERLLEFESYTNDLKNGHFQHVQGDSLIIGSFKNDKLHGDYKIYFDHIRFLLGGVINTDMDRLTLISEGSFSEDIKTGYWKDYDLTGTLREEGKFLNGSETGEWKYYYSNWTDSLGKPTQYSRELYLVLNYVNGEAHGKSTRYSVLTEREYPCSEIDQDGNPLDTCRKNVYTKLLESSFYKNDKVHGPYELRDSINEVVARGEYKGGFKEGDWFERYTEMNLNEETYFVYQRGNYTNNIREGKWIQYYTEGEISETFNYKNGELHGERIVWNQYGLPATKELFDSGKITELVNYDDLGEKPIEKFEIYDEKYDSYKCRRTEFFDTGNNSQEYWLKKDEYFDNNWPELAFLVATSKFDSDGVKGYKCGEFKLFNSENKPIIVGEYWKEDKIGTWKMYDYDQNIVIETNYIQNNPVSENYFGLNGELYSGDFVSFDKENGIREERKIKNGLRNGRTTYIDTNTEKTIRKENYKNGVLK